ncbi:hypothetical protein GCM10017687_28450 [Streptomyces echinatus]
MPHTGFALPELAGRWLPDSATTTRSLIASDRLAIRDAVGDVHEASRS